MISLHPSCITDAVDPDSSEMARKDSQHEAHAVNSNAERRASALETKEENASHEHQPEQQLPEASPDAPSPTTEAVSTDIQLTVNEADVPLYELASPRSVPRTKRPSHKQHEEHESEEERRTAAEPRPSLIVSRLSQRIRSMSEPVALNELDLQYLAEPPKERERSSLARVQNAEPRHTDHDANTIEQLPLQEHAQLPAQAQAQTQTHAKQPLPKSPKMGFVKRLFGKLKHKGLFYRYTALLPHRSKVRATMTTTHSHHHRLSTRANRPRQVTVTSMPGFMHTTRVTRYMMSRAF
jgi:hypothetical protein